MIIWESFHEYFTILKATISVIWLRGQEKNAVLIFFDQNFKKVLWDMTRIRANSMKKCGHLRFNHLKDHESIVKSALGEKNFKSRQILFLISKSILCHTQSDHLNNETKPYQELQSFDKICQIYVVKIFQALGKKIY